MILYWMTLYISVGLIYSLLLFYLSNDRPELYIMLHIFGVPYEMMEEYMLVLYFLGVFLWPSFMLYDIYMYYKNRG